MSKLPGVATTSVEDLADRLAVDPGDVRVILRSFVDGERVELDSEMIDTVCHQLDPHGERTVPGLYGYDEDREEPPGPMNPLGSY